MKHSNKSWSFSIIFFGLTTLSFSQSSMIKWYDKTNLGSEIISMESVIQEGDYLYTAVTLFSQKLKLPKYHMLKINNEGIIEKDLILDKDQNGHEIIFQYLGQTNGEIYGYYESRSEEMTTLYRDQIDKSTLKFKGNEVKIMSGKKGNNPNAWTWRSIAFTKQIRIEFNYFSNGVFYLQYDPSLDYHLILKLEPSDAKSQPVIKTQLYNGKLELLNDTKFVLPGTNVDTELFNVEADKAGNIYLISAYYVDKIPSFTLSVANIKTKSVDHIKIVTDGLIRTVTSTHSPTGLAIGCIQGENRKDRELDLVTLLYDANSNSFSNAQTIEKDIFDDDDNLYCVSNDKSYVIVTQFFTESHLITNDNATISSHERDSPRYGGDITAYNYNFEGNQLWKNTIKNDVAVGGGSNTFDELFLFGLNDLFYLLYNISPENIERAAKGEKLKTGWPTGKGSLATEIVKFDENGKMNRKLIYLPADKIVTIPDLSKYLGHNDFLVIGDIANLGNSFHFGKFTITEDGH